jgi:hypothetical protein
MAARPTLELPLRNPIPKVRYLHFEPGSKTITLRLAVHLESLLQAGVTIIKTQASMTSTTLHWSKRLMLTKTLPMALVGVAQPFFHVQFNGRVFRSKMSKAPFLVWRSS